MALNYPYLCFICIFTLIDNVILVLKENKFLCSDIVQLLIVLRIRSTYIPLLFETIFRYKHVLLKLNYFLSEKMNWDGSTNRHNITRNRWKKCLMSTCLQLVSYNVHIKDFFFQVPQAKTFVVWLNQISNNRVCSLRAHL